MSAPPSDVVSAWQAALAAEHRAVFDYALLGPRLTGERRQLAVTCSDEHQDVRDATSAALATAGRTPVGPEPDYPTLYPVANSTAALRLAVTLEDTAAAAWRFLFAHAAARSGQASAGVRTSAQTNLTASAVRAARWRRFTDPTRATTPFPGI